MKTAKLFTTRQHQAVRFPREFRFEGEAVQIRRQGKAVILEPIPLDWAWLGEVIDTFSDDFFAEDGSNPPCRGQTGRDRKRGRTDTTNCAAARHKAS